MTEPQQQMVITGEQMSRVYNAGSMKDVHSVMDEIRDITENTRSRPIPAGDEHR